MNLIDYFKFISELKNIGIISPVKSLFSLKDEDLNYKIFKTKEDFERFALDVSNVKEKLLKLNLLLKKYKRKKVRLLGRCVSSNRVNVFVCEFMSKFSDDILPHETFRCKCCYLGNRIRAMMHIFKLMEKNPENLKIYLYEYNTKFYNAFIKKFGKKNTIIGSEFFGDDVKPGEIVNGVRNENALNLSFEDNCLDYILSGDVFEHVSDIDKALFEVYRCLKKDGKLILHVPLTYKDKTIVRAKIEDGVIKYLEPKEYHAGFSAKDPNGCLAFYNFGWDIMDKIKSAGFSDCYMVAISDIRFLNIGYEPVVTFVAVK